MLENISRSLKDVLGPEYIEALGTTARYLHRLTQEEIKDLTDEAVDFYSEERIHQINHLLQFVGSSVVGSMNVVNTGASTKAYSNELNLNAAPIGGTGPYRIGEDGRLYLAVKSEHYHASLGHHFEGFHLIDKARTLGMVNATHNNTRGYVTRRLECELIRTINGLDKHAVSELNLILHHGGSKVLNRIINLETGSLAVEAGIKMMLARFYRSEKQLPQPRYENRIPVFFVIADNQGTLEANYHGTTVLTQMLRGLWPSLYQAIEQSRLFKIVGVNINDIQDFARKIDVYNRGMFKTAGFLHEIILMNYGGICLTPEYLRQAYRLCAETDTPTLVDEIQSCAWYPGMYLFRHYNITPDFVVLGKGLPGGEYPASKIITTDEMDILTQLGALVTNGQEELASLAYLVTMEFVQANSQNIDKLCQYFESRLADFQKRHEKRIVRCEGAGLLASLHFDSVNEARQFSARMNGAGIDINIQLYKPNCPPAVPLKLPLISTRQVIDHLFANMDKALQ